MIAAELDPVGLDEVLAHADLQTRLDRKYLLPLEILERLLDGLAGTHRVLEVDGRRDFGYRSTYYDTPDLRCLREHLQGRRRRFKCRKRRYVESDRSMLELKLKGARGATVKNAVACAPADDLCDAERSFLRAGVLAAYGVDLAVDALVPALEVRCRRVTLAAPALGERLTCDLDLELGDLRLRPGMAVVESKSATPRATADRQLALLGFRPVERCSKYCLGMAFSRPDVRGNDLRPLRRWFETA